MLPDAITRRANSVQLQIGDDQKQLVSPDEFRTQLHNVIGRNSIYELIAANRIRHIRIGRKILIPVSEIVDFPRREAGGDV